MNTLKDRLVSMIRASGPIPVSLYMETCLHDPHEGYYATRPGLGTDFITAPETSQIFGELLGLWAAHEWQAIGAPSPFSLVEIGAGRGTLTADALRATSSLNAFSDGLSLRLVEASPALRDIQTDRLGPYNPQFADSLASIAAGPAIILANEYLDCLPARQFVKTGETWNERVVGISEQGELCFGLAADRSPPAPTLATTDDIQAVEIQPALDVLVDALKKRSEDGAPFRALFVDYGPATTAPGDTLRAFSNGAQIDPLAAPGRSDLTVDVDFSRLKRLAEAAGLSVHGPIAQGPFLMALGAQARLDSLIKSHPEKAKALYDGVARLVDPDQMGERFNAICISSRNLPAPAGF